MKPTHLLLLETPEFTIFLWSNSFSLLLTLVDEFVVALEKSEENTEEAVMVISNPKITRHGN